MKRNGQNPVLPHPDHRSSNVCICGCTYGHHRFGNYEFDVNGQPTADPHGGSCTTVQPTLGFDVDPHGIQGWTGCECKKFVPQTHGK